MRKIMFSLAALVMTSVTYAQLQQTQPLQQKTITPSEQKVTHGLDTSKSMVVFDDTQRYSLQNSTQIFNDVFGASGQRSFSEVRSSDDKLGFTHQRFQQYHNSIKVEFGTVSLHSRNNKVEFLTSEFYAIDENFNAEPSIGNIDAFNRAVNHIDADEYLWQFEDASIEMDYQKPEGELVILPLYSDSMSKNGPELRLAYKFDIYATFPISRGDLFIDAMTGEALFYNATIKHADNNGHVGAVAEKIETEEEYCARIEGETYMALVSGTAATRYSGSRTIETRVAGPDFSLNDDIRDVFTRDALEQAPGTTYPYITNYSEFLDNDNNWTAGEWDNADKDNAALDAHWGAMMTWDYWDQIHGRDSYNNGGASIRSYVHVDVDYDNAFWNGQVMSYGDGSSNGNEGNGFFDALTSLDVAAHEIGHAVTTFTSNLAYQRESGAMNEGFSDIWGAAVEQFAKGNGSDTSPSAEIWLIGDEIDRRAGSAALRSMSNPTSLGQPDTYGGTNWINPNCGAPTNANDYCGVHTNSGVLNFWYYLLVEGGSGTNDVGSAFNVSSIGFAKASALSYTLLQALSANSTFANARTISIQAAETAYGACSSEVASVTDAWYAVGVGTAFVNNCTAEIAFSSLTGAQVENSECGFVDVTIPVSIGATPTAAATVNFTVGSGSGTNNEDFSLETSSLTFPTGTSASQNIIVRVYHDSFIEGNETAVIDFTVIPNSGDAVADLAADQFTLTIVNDDAVHSASANVTLYDEDIEGPAYELTTNNSDPGGTPVAAWGLGNTASASSGFWSTSGNATNFAFTNDDDCNCDKSDDQLTTTAIDMSGAYSSATLTFDHAFADLGAEIGDVLVSTNGGTSFTSVLTLSNTSTDNGGGSFTTPWVNGVTVDMTPYIGQADVRVQFRYNDGGAWLYGMAVDNIVVTAVTATDIQTAVNTGAGTEDDLNIYKDGTVYSSDATTGNVMATLTNNQADDYGCTTVAVNRAGTGAQAYNGSTSPNLAMDKRFVITPTNAIGSGDTQMTFYFTAGEISGWEAVTGLSDTDLVIAREEGGAIVETSAVTLGTFGTAVTLTGDFTDLEGEYYFGSAATFVAACAGVTKTWDGTDWIPAGAPGLTNAVIIDNTYDTGLHGDINACTVTVNVTESLTVRAGDFINVVGNIVVDGTLQVDHTGSVVQTNDSATVTKGGSGAINVAISTPGLKDRDFVIMGSPLDGTMRENTLSSVWKVLANTPGNFIPHPDVLTTHGTTFADDNGNDWNSFTTGAITVGEGFIVRPVYEHGSTPIVYDYTFSEGTLNNGVVTRPMVFNGLGANPGGTPNVYANPYASAISVNDFMTVNTDVAAVFYWEHITHPSSAIDGYHSINFDMDDISIYNGAMGTPAANDLTADMPTNMMSSGQGFGVLATSTGTVTFNNSMRRTNENGEMRNAQSIIESLLLRVRNDEFGVGSYAGLAFTDFTTEGLDARYDTERITTSVSLYSHLSDGSSALAIQSRELFDANMQIPMGFVSQIDAPTEFTFSIANVLGAEVSQADVMLLDTFTGVTTNLSENDYVFTSDIGQHDGRFLIMFATEVLGTQDELLETLTVYPNPTSDVINIVSPQSAIQQVTVYDMMGRVVLQLDGANQNNVQLDLSSVNNALYFVEINTEQGVITQRIVKE